jgi:hypothetical protein
MSQIILIRSIIITKYLLGENKTILYLWSKKYQYFQGVMKNSKKADFSPLFAKLDLKILYREEGLSTVCKVENIEYISPYLSGKANLIRLMMNYLLHHSLRKWLIDEEFFDYYVDLLLQLRQDDDLALLIYFLDQVLFQIGFGLQYLYDSNGLPLNKKQPFDLTREGFINRKSGLLPHIFLALEDKKINQLLYKDQQLLLKSLFSYWQLQTQVYTEPIFFNLLTIN